MQVEQAGRVQQRLPAGGEAGDLDPVQALGAVVADPYHDMTGCGADLLGPPDTGGANPGMTQPAPAQGAGLQGPGPVAVEQLDDYWFPVQQGHVEQIRVAGGARHHDRQRPRALDVDEVPDPLGADPPAHFDVAPYRAGTQGDTAASGFGNHGTGGLEPFRVGQRHDGPLTAGNLAVGFHEDQFGALLDQADVGVDAGHHQGSLWAIAGGVVEQGDVRLPLWAADHAQPAAAAAVHVGTGDHPAVQVVAVVIETYPGAAVVDVGLSGVRDLTHPHPPLFVLLHP